MEKITYDIQQEINSFIAKYLFLSDRITSVKLSDSSWTLKEILGHLIDSASNNQQRFVRLQIIEKLEFPDYQKDNELWLQIQNYNELSWNIIIALWENYNLLLINIIRNIQKSSLKHQWLANNQSITLRDLVVDYVRHLKEHIQHFEKRYQEVLAKVYSY